MHFGMSPIDMYNEAVKCADIAKSTNTKPDAALICAILKKVFKNTLFEIY